MYAEYLYLSLDYGQLLAWVWCIGEYSNLIMWRVYNGVSNLDLKECGLSTLVNDY